MKRIFNTTRAFPQAVHNTLLAGMALMLMAGTGSLSAALAITEPVTLKQLRVSDIIYLPTVRSQRVLTFTKPKTWQLSPSSRIHVEFQHSFELIPERSWLDVLVNDKVVYHTALTKENAKGTTLDIPLPVGILKDFNTLTFRVEQHYASRCEDPLDPSLWTQILPSSQIVFEYTPILPEVDLAKFPYPIIDPLTYSPQAIHYVVPTSAKDKELQALGYLNMNFAQAASYKQTRTGVSLPDETPTRNAHLVYVGTPADNPALAQYQDIISSQTGYAFSGGQWTNVHTHQPLAGDAGLLLYFAHPSLKDRAVLVVSGNTPEGVLQAAHYVTNHPIEAGMKGQAMVVPETWNPQSEHSAKVPRFIEKQSRTLGELGYGEESVEKINAPPITYQIPVLSDFKKSGAKLYLDLVYSYGSRDGSKINPRYSSLEIRMNEVPIANIPLLNVDKGENFARATVLLPKDLIQTSNTLVAQYHLMPDKYGFCVGSYDDKAWGKIHADSKIRVDGYPGSILPNVGVLNYTAFPYARDDNFKNTHFILPKELNVSDLRAYLGLTTRLGRATLSDTDLRFTVSQGDDVPYKSKDVIIVQDLNHPVHLPDGYHLGWLTENPLIRQFSLQYPNAGEQHAVSVYENSAGTYMEQYMAPWNKELVVTAVSSKSPQGLETLATMLEDDDLFAKLTPGPLKQLANLDGSLNTAEAQPVRIEQQPGLENAANWWQWLQQLSWPMIIGVAVLLAIALVLLPVIIRRIRYRY